MVSQQMPNTASPLISCDSLHSEADIVVTESVRGFLGHKGMYILLGGHANTVEAFQWDKVSNTKRPGLDSDFTQRKQPRKTGK